MTTHDSPLDHSPFTTPHSPSMTTFPPPHYIKTESALPGIDVYMPAPPSEDESLKSVIQFHCPQCDGITGYNTEDGGLTCSFCGYHEAPQQKIVGKGAEEFEFKVETLQQASHGWGVDRKEIVCQRCAAHTIVAPDELTHTCPFCGSNQVIQQKAAQDVLRPRFLIPLQITAEQCAGQVRQWLGSSWMTPGSLRDLAKLAEFTPIYLPYWTFDAITRADWKAEVGHTRTYTTGSGKNRRTHTQTVWRWESGQASLTIDDLCVPGTSRLSQILLNQLGNFDTHALAAYEPKFLAGMQAQAYDVPLEQGWERGREQMREKTKSACYSQASTQKIRNFSMNLDFSNESWRYILLPVYMAVYQYQEQTFQVMVNGQTGTVGGQRPVDWVKVWLAMIAAALPGLFLGFVAFIALFLGGAGVIVAPFALIVLIVGLVFAVRWYQTAQAMDDV
ncbi:MAG: hypothetical protein V9G20_18755 [Candidatus Promineifilaceae bacterium]